MKSIAFLRTRSPVLRSISGPGLPLAWTFILGLLIGWACLCLGVAVASFLKSAQAADAPLPAPIVMGKPVVARELFERYTYPARVLPKVSSKILAEDDGVVSRILAPLGEKVRRGQRILVISHTDPVYRYAPLTVVSPIQGIVSETSVSEGSQVTKGQALISVTDPRRVRITMEVPAGDLSGLSRGQSAELKLPGHSQSIQLSIRGISPYVDPATGTATCELEPVAPDASLSPGLVGRVSLKLHSRKGIAIPEYALIYQDDKPYVRTYLGGKAKLVPVDLGQRQDGQIEILQGLKPKDILIERASRHVADGEVVKLQEAGTAADGAG